jgi:hypothetical protein
MKIGTNLLRLLLFTFLVMGCNSRQKEKALQQKEDSLNQREQQLLLKEKTLEIREAELVRKEKRRDSTSRIDSTSFYNPALIGNWSVKMTCTETTCTGSAVGDVNNQEWNFSYQGNTIIAKVMEGNQLVRTYTGSYKNNAVEMTEGVQNTAAQQGVKMLVRLRIINGTTMDGQREIIRENNCKIIYALELQKKP